MSDRESTLQEQTVCGCDFAGRCTIDHETGLPLAWEAETPQRRENSESCEAEE